MISERLGTLPTVSTTNWITIVGIVAASIIAILKIARDIHADFQPEAEGRVRQYKTAFGWFLWVLVIGLQIWNIASAFRPPDHPTHAKLVASMLIVSFSVCMLFLIVIQSFLRKMLDVQTKHIDVTKSAWQLTYTLSKVLALVANEVPLKDETGKKVEELMSESGDIH